MSPVTTCSGGSSPPRWKGETLPRDDILDILGLLMIAGLDTVAASLACFLSYFARFPTSGHG